MTTGNEAELRKELDPNERLLWSGSPRSGLLLRRADLFLVPLSLLWTAFIFFWIASVVAAHAPPFFLAFATPFLAIALYQLAGRFFVDSWLRAMTHYGITDARVIILSTFYGRRIQSLRISDLAEVTLIERAGGFGTIRFGRQSRFFAVLQGWPEMRVFLLPCLDSIPNARTVYQTLRDAQRAGSH